MFLPRTLLMKIYNADNELTLEGLPEEALQSMMLGAKDAAKLAVEDDGGKLVAAWRRLASLVAHVFPEIGCLVRCRRYPWPPHFGKILAITLVRFAALPLLAIRIGRSL